MASATGRVFQSSEEASRQEGARALLYRSAFAQGNEGTHEQEALRSTSDLMQPPKRRISADELKRLMDQALRWVGAVAQAADNEVFEWQGPVPPPPDAELDLEATLLHEAHGQMLMLSSRHPRNVAVVLCVDASTSMMGLKRDWATLAVAAFGWLQRHQPHRAVFFESKATAMPDATGASELLLKWLELDLGGTTHLEAGMELALEQERVLKLRYRRVSTILVTDGHYTNGRDPRYLAGQFRNLHVLALGPGDGRGAELCTELARLGHGQVFQVPEMTELPRALVGLARQRNR